MQESLSLRRTAVAVLMLLLGSAIPAAAQDEGIDAADVNIKISVTGRMQAFDGPSGIPAVLLDIIRDEEALQEFQIVGSSNDQGGCPYKVHSNLQPCG